MGEEIKALVNTGANGIRGGDYIVEHGFKVLRRMKRTGNLWSEVQTRQRGGIRYREFKWATPRKGNGPLALFNNMTSAINFAKTQADRFRIWLPSAKWTVEVYAAEYRPSMNKDFWYMANGETRYIHGHIPIFTEYADAIKTTDLLWEEVQGEVIR